MGWHGIAALLLVPLSGAALFAADPITLAASSRQTFVTCAPDQPTVVPLRWAGGRFFTTEGSGSRSPNLCVATGDGNIKRIPLEIPGVQAIGPYDATVSSSGDLYVSAAAFDSDSRLTTFFAKISERGQTIQVCRTFPHFPARLAAAADGTVWTVGWNTDQEQTRTVDRFIVNRFDAGCNLVQAIRPAVRPTAHPSSSQLQASDSGVALRTRSNEIVEFSLDGEEIGRYDGPRLSKEDNPASTTFAVSSSGIIAWGTVDPKGSNVWVLDRENGTWQNANASNGFSLGDRLMGFEGEDLVIGVRESIGQTRMTWLQVIHPSSDNRAYLRRRSERR